MLNRHYMEYLEFEKQDLINLEKSLTLEVLRTSRSGGYSFSTICGCNTRKYHGLLVSQIDESENDLGVLLASLDETVVLDHTEFNLGIHAYKYGNFSPKGHKYLHHFEWNNLPVLTYKIGDAFLTKESVFVSGKDQLLVKYTLSEASRAATIKFSPCFCFRNQHELGKLTTLANTTPYEAPNGIGFRIFPSYPIVYLQFSKKTEFTPSSHWLMDVEYTKEMERGYAYNEDLLTTGSFKTTLNNDESIIVSVSLNSCDCKLISNRFDEEKLKRIPRSSFNDCLCNAAQQFIVVARNGMNIKAGFPWYNARARDLFVSIPGLLLSTEDPDISAPLLHKILSDIEQFLESGTIPVDVAEYDSPDTLLWAVRTLELLIESNNFENEKLRQVYASAMQAIAENKMQHLTLHENGLLYTDGKNKAVSWMNATYNGKPSVCRTGYLIELNALWYNALTYFIANFNTNTSQKTTFAEWQIRCGHTMQELFVVENENYLYDFVDPGCNAQDKSIRPNMIFAVSLPFSPFPKNRQKEVIDTIERNLLTPRGLRTLSPGHPEYSGNISGEPEIRNRDCFNGMAWPWLIGAYVDAYLKIYHQSGVHYLKALLNEFEMEMHQNCLGTISEYYNGNPPHEAGGAVSFAMSVAELLRATKKLETFYPLMQS